MSAWFVIAPIVHSFPTRRSSDLVGLYLGEGRHQVVNRGLQQLRGAARGLEHAILDGLRGLVDLDQLLEQLVVGRSEEHTSELQSRPHLVCRLLLEKKN